jgi:hypothetical protein
LTLHLVSVCLFATQTQFLAILFPFQSNLNRFSPSTQEYVSQTPHVSGHIDDTPFHEQRCVVDFFAAQLQSRNMLDPSGLIIRKRKVESSHGVGVFTGEGVGADVDVIGEGVGAGVDPFPI